MSIDSQILKLYDDLDRLAEQINRLNADKTPFQNGYEDAKDGYDNKNNYYWGSSDRQRYNEGYAVGKIAREVSDG